MYDWTTFAGFPEEPMPHFDFTCAGCSVDFIATGLYPRCPRCGREVHPDSPDARTEGCGAPGPTRGPAVVSYCDECRTAVSSIESCSERPCPFCGFPLRDLPPFPEPREPEKPAVKR